MIFLSIIAIVVLAMVFGSRRFIALCNLALCVMGVLLVVNIARADARPTLSIQHYPLYHDATMLKQCALDRHIQMIEVNRINTQLRMVEPMAEMVARNGQPAVREYLGHIQHERLVSDLRTYQMLDREAQFRHCSAIRDRHP